MTYTMYNMPRPVLASRHKTLDWVDGAAAVFVVIWVSEAFARLGLNTFFTVMVYAYFVPRFYFAARWLFPAVLRIWPMLLYPALCMVSVAWSLVPQISFVAAIQLWFTLCLGVFLGHRFRLSGLAALIVTGLGLTILLSLVNLTNLWPPAFGPDGGFQGIYTNKNALGQRCALVILTGALFFVSQRAAAVRWAWCGWLVCVAAVLTLTQSITAIVLCVLAVGGFGLATLRGPAFTGLTIILCCLVASGLVAVWSLDIALIEDGLAALGKTSTLTGRTLLWEIAMNRAQDRPLLGVGYMAYWSAPEFAQDVSIINGLYGATVEAFHNVFLETLVMLGPFGVVSMAALIGFSMRAIWRAPKGSLRTWALALFAVLIFSAMLGSSLYRPHELTLLMVVALAAACAAASEAALPVARSSETTPRPMPPKVQS